MIPKRITKKSENGFYISKSKQKGSDWLTFKFYFINCKNHQTLRLSYVSIWIYFKPFLIHWLLLSF